MEGEQIFKDYEQVKGYFKTIGVEYKFNCLYEKDPEGCTLLGDFYEAIEKDFLKAFKTYKFGCEEQSYAKSCNKLGAYYFLGRGIDQDKNQAFKVWEKGCFEAKGRDYGISCLNGGQMLIDKKDLDKNKIEISEEKGIRMLERGCDNEVADSCFVASGYFYDKKLNEKAFSLAEKGCNLNHIECCSNLYFMLKNGIGTKIDLNLAQKFKEKTENLQKQLSQEGISYGL